MKTHTSKRVKLKTKYTLKKKKAQRKIKIKRDMKKNPNKYHKKKADPGVPTKCPFKLQVLEERSGVIEQKALEKQQRRDHVLEQRKKMREAKVAEKRKLTDVIKLNGENKEEEEEDFDDDMDDEEEMEGEEGDQQMKEEKPWDQLTEEEKQQRKAKQLADKASLLNRRFRKALMYDYKNYREKDDPDFRWRNWTDKVYYRQVKEVVTRADVILEVIDARDPLGTRSPVLEKMIREQQIKRKRLVLILNKADLIPKSNLQAWLKYLRHEAPTVPFKASIQRSRKLKTFKSRWRHMGEEVMRTPSAMGGDVLLQLLKNYSRSSPDTGIVVGVVGLPNVGKSSLINSMKNITVCDVAPVPGCTKNIQEVKLDKKLFMLDCPGVVMPNRKLDPVEAALRNLVKVENMRNAPECAAEIFRRSDKVKLSLVYTIRTTETPEEFLHLVAKRFNMMNNNGIPCIEKAAKRVVYDWNHGYLKYYTEVPKRTDTKAKAVLRTSLAEALQLDTSTTAEEKQEFQQKDEAFFSHIEDHFVKFSESMKVQHKAVKNLEAPSNYREVEELMED